MHWNELARLQAIGGAAWRKYERLVEQAHGAQPGSSAFLAKVTFERLWQANPEAVKAQCEADEGISKFRVVADSGPLEPVTAPTILDLWIPSKGEEQ
jgi:hypothetical protein